MDSFKTRCPSVIRKARIENAGAVNWSLTESEADQARVVVGAFEPDIVNRAVYFGGAKNLLDLIG